MKILELFCGLGGWSRGFHDIFPDAEFYGIDIKDYGYPYNFIKADLNDWEPDQEYDIVLASPPCTEFSIAKKWSQGTQDERIGLDLIWRAFYLIEKIKPKFWIIENVRGLADFLPEPDEIVKYNRHKDGKAAYLWSNIGKLGFLECMINYRSKTADKSKNYPNKNYKKPLNKKATCRTKEDRALIPLPLAHEAARKIYAKL